MKTEQLLYKLVSPAGVAGDEKRSFEQLRELFSQYGTVKTDNLGSIIIERAGEGKHIMLDAHLDTIGFVVAGIENGGFLRLAPVGGIDMRAVAGAELTVHGKEDIFAVICTVPPHLSKGESRPIEGDCYADTGLTEENLKAVVSVGDSAGFKNSFSKIGENRISSPYMDDRSGAVTLLKALEYTESRHKITLVLSAQEETGGSGAKCSAYSLAPDLSLAVDVSFAETPDANKKECGKIGAGPMVGFSPTLDSEFSRLLCEIAEKEGIPYQREVMGGRTSTNADQISISRGAVPSALVSVPLKFMHSPNETVDLRDIENSARLIARFLERV